MPTVFGVDPATMCGWSRVQPGRILASGATDLVRLGARGNAWQSATLGMGELLTRHAGVGDAVAYEDVHHHTGIEAAQWYGSLRGALWLWCEARGVRVIPISVQAGKRALTGTGAASKAQSVAAVARRFNIVCATHDEADAIGIALAALETQ